MKRRYPNAAKVYKKLCISKMFNAGDLFAHEDVDGFGKIHQMIWVGIGEGSLKEIEWACQNIAQIPQIDKSINEIVSGGWKVLNDWQAVQFFMTRELKQAACRIVVLEEDIENKIAGNIEFRDCWGTRR